MSEATRTLHRPTLEANTAGNGKATGQADDRGYRLDLFKRFPRLKSFVKMPLFQLITTLPNMLVFYIIIMAGVIGTPVGNANISIVFIWILWWFALIALLVPFGSRSWCTMCPMPIFGDWLQRRAITRVRSGKSPGGLNNKMFGLHKKWPKSLSNIWIQNFAFLAMATFSALLVTRPGVTAAVLGGMTLLATGLALVYRMRTFCTYLCPVSGFLSLYSMTSTLELRSNDPDVCLKCKSKACRTGSENGWGCPWFLYMGKLDRNNYCGLCMECVKSCPNDNIALNLRPFASDSNIKGLDEAWKGFIMLALAMAYSIILLGPNGTIKDWANIAETGNWGGFTVYATILWASALLLLPATFFAFTWIARKLAGGESVPMKRVFLKYAYLLVPLGLLAWIAFSVPLLFVNGAYIVSVISDPFGWGWDLFGTANAKWTPILPEYLIYGQVLFLSYGLYIALRKGFVLGLELFNSEAAASRGLIPMGAFSVLVTLAFVTFFGG